jgi:transposase-like protein
LGLWAGDGSEGAKHWLHNLTEIKNRGVSDVLMLVYDGLTGLPEAVETVFLPRRQRSWSGQEGRRGPGRGRGDSGG